MLKDGYLADLPIVVAAIDPCFSCTDRLMSVMNAGAGRQDVMNWGQLRSYGIEWYRRRGIDFSRLNRTFGPGEVT
jgi:NADH-quinone oxidoreductase subunit D